jgi:glucosamine-6-phosphate deaminase
MEILLAANEERAAERAAGLIAAALRAEPALVLGLATGRTMERVYAHLVRLHRDQGLDFSACTTFNLDEYAGLPAAHPGAYRRYMDEHLFRAVNVRPERTFVPDGMAADLDAEGRRYEALIGAAGGIGLQLLGLGLTGHIGFNEPPADFASRTRPVALHPLTRAQNAECFGGDPGAVPARAITMGVATILAARRCLLLATGPGKAAILAAALEGPVTPAVPASVLQRHPDCVVIADEAAAARLAPGCARAT